MRRYKKLNLRRAADKFRRIPREEQRRQDDWIDVARYYLSTPQIPDYVKRGNLAASFTDTQPLENGDTFTATLNWYL